MLLGVKERKFGVNLVKIPSPPSSCQNTCFTGSRSIYMSDESKYEITQHSSFYRKPTKAITFCFSNCGM